MLFKGGNWRGDLRLLCCVFMSCMGSFLFAYDTGIVGGVLKSPAFQRDFKYTMADQVNVNSHCASLLQAGAFLGCFAVWPIARWIGRPKALMTGAFIFILGGIVQTINTGSIGAFYAGRTIGGIGVGMVTVIVPIYSAEMTPVALRGSFGACFQMFYAFGVCTSYWVTYATNVHMAPSTAQWQIPIGLQLVPAGLLLFGMFFVKETPRWLAMKGRADEALHNLIWVRGGDSDAVQAEWQGMSASIEEEMEETKGYKWKEFISPTNRFRLFCIVSMQLGVQITGNTPLGYYAPQIFGSIGAGDQKMLITGIFGIIKVVSTMTFVFFLADRINRKTAFMGGAAAMGTFMLIVAVVVKTHTPNPEAPSINPAGMATIAMVYLESASYNMSWGPVSWLYISECFTNRNREIGTAIGAASQWAFNFMMSKITPYALKSLGADGTFFMFAGMNYCLIVYVWFVLVETKHSTLENMDATFQTGKKTGNEDAEKVEVSPRDSNSTQVQQEEQSGNASVNDDSSQRSSPAAVVSSTSAENTTK